MSTSNVGKKLFVSRGLEQFDIKHVLMVCILLFDLVNCISFAACVLKGLIQMTTMLILVPYINIKHK